MNGQSWRGPIGVLLGLVLLAVVAGFAYQAGTQAAVPAAAAGAGEMRHYGWHGGGFFFFPFLFFPIGLLLFFGLMRALFWGGPRRWDSGYGPYDGGPRHFEEWHRRMHEHEGTSASTTTTTTPPPTTPSDPGRPASS